MTAAVLFLLALLPQLVDRTKDPIPAPPSRELSHEKRADIFMARKMYREGVETYQLALQQQESSKLYNKLGIAYHHLMMFPYATRSYQKAVRLDNDYSQAINNLGTVLLRAKEVQEGDSPVQKGPQGEARGRQPSTVTSARPTSRAKSTRDATREYLQALAARPSWYSNTAAPSERCCRSAASEDRAQYNYFMARTYASAEIFDKALLYLRRAFEEGYKKRKKVAEDPVFAPLLENPLFQQFVFPNQTTAQLR